ncbi:MAG: polyhydroxyalkanoic acid system family protein [Planctomycetia bacterium]|nr:polyhydroxyalkanoic acid system family protein [Planctomycetia bacterium]
MPSFRIQVPNSRPREEKVARLRSFVSRMERKFAGNISQARSEWTDDRMTFSLVFHGFRIAGTMTVENEEVIVEGRIPILAVPFMRRIEDEIAHAITEELADSDATVRIG